MTDTQIINEAKKDFADTFPPGIFELEAKTRVFYNYARFELRLRETEAGKYAITCIEQDDRHFDAKRFYRWYHKTYLQDTIK